MAALSPVAAGGATTPRSVGRAASPPLGLQAAGVGGVDDEPEVFETEGDGPREGLVDGPIATEDEGAAGAAGGAGGSSVETATLDTTPLSAESAFATFMGKLYDRAGAGALQSAGQETSYEVHTEATRSGRGGRPLGTISGVETPLQRFQRLKAEVQELDDDLSALATAVSDAACAHAAVVCAALMQTLLNAALEGGRAQDAGSVGRSNRGSGRIAR